MSWQSRSGTKLIFVPVFLACLPPINQPFGGQNNGRPVYTSHSAGELTKGIPAPCRGRALNWENVWGFRSRRGQTVSRPSGYCSAAIRRIEEIGKHQRPTTFPLSRVLSLYALSFGLAPAAYIHSFSFLDRFCNVTILIYSRSFLLYWSFYLSFSRGLFYSQFFYSSEYACIRSYLLFDKSIFNRKKI